MRSQLEASNTYQEIITKMNSKINKIETTLPDDEKIDLMIKWARLEHMIEFAIENRFMQICPWCVCLAFMSGSFVHKLAIIDLFGLTEVDMHLLNTMMAAAMFEGTMEINWKGTP